MKKVKSAFQRYFSKNKPPKGFVASQNPDGSMVWHLPKRPRLKRRPY